MAGRSILHACRHTFLKKISCMYLSLYILINIDNEEEISSKEMGSRRETRGEMVNREICFEFETSHLIS